MCERLSTIVKRIQKKALLKISKNKRGVTLIELIVTFALISLFAVLSCQVLSSAMNVFYKIQALNFGRQVSDTLMDKVCGQIEGAHVEMKWREIEHTLIIDKDRNKIDLYNRSDSRICIYNDPEKQLVIYYYPISGGNETDKGFKEVYWTFDEKMYLGYKIKELKFTQPKGDYEDNIIKVELEISHSKYGEYKSTRYVECYNFQTEDNFKKIHDDGSEH